MEDDNLTEKQMEEIAKTHQTLENITRMNKSLLLLCKIENGQYADVKEICVNSLLEQYIETFGEIYGYKNINVVYSPESTFMLEMNESLSVMMVTNLLKNAFVHNVDGGDIVVKVSGRGFSVASSGDMALDSSQIFTRFYQGSKKEGSTGLGLALVNTICKAAGLKISYDFNEKMHIFSISK